MNFNIDMQDKLATTSQYIKFLEEKNNSLILDLQNSTSIQNNYMEILEKTNNSISMIYNPYGIMVTALSVLFTVLTIAAAIIIWYQSRENKRIVREELNEALNNIKTNVLKDFQVQVDSITEDIKNATGEQKNKLEKDLEKIEKTKQDIENSLQLSLISNSRYLKEVDYLCINCRSGIYGLNSFANLGSGITVPVVPQPLRLYYTQNHCIKCGNLIF